MHIGARAVPLSAVKLRGSAQNNRVIVVKSEDCATPEGDVEWLTRYS